MAGQGEAPLVITDVGELSEFAATRAFTSTRPVVLQLPGMSPSDAFAVGERLNRDRAECGCSVGAKAMSAGFVLALVTLILRHGLFTAALLVRLPLVIVAATVFAVLGKVAGIALGRRRARQQVLRIVETIQPRT